jgi:preprotein translocase subunit SecF
MFTLIGKTNIDFVGKRKPAFVLSLLMLLLGLWGSVQLATGKAAMATDFAGGATVDLKLEKPEPIENLRAVLRSAGVAVDVQQLQGEAHYLVRVPLDGDDISHLDGSVVEAVRKGLADNKVTDSSSTVVGPAVSRDLRNKSLMASLIVALGILLYVGIRFDLRFAVGAVLATAHDVLFVLGLIVLMGHDFSMLIVTALLTVAGYSLNDTVVVYDRIRENLKARRAEAYGTVVNASINETLTRTVVTGLTTLIAVSILYVWGGEVTKDFSLVLLLGIVIGTYSSVFVAAPLVVEWNQRSPVRR